MIPEDRRYTKEHEWLQMNDGLITVGITEHAQAELGDIVYVELPEVGTELLSGEGICIIESVKAVANVNAPFASTIEAVNDQLDAEPDQLNTSPYHAWIVKLSAADANLDDFMDADAYAKLIAE